MDTVRTRTRSEARKGPEPCAVTSLPRGGAGQDTAEAKATTRDPDAPNIVRLRLVLSLVTEGKSQKEIAARIGRDPRTVRRMIAQATDAMKRALTTFGNPFGLALYDKEQQNVRGRGRAQRRTGANGKAHAITWLVLSSEGEYVSAHENAVDYCKAIRQLLEAISTREHLRAFWQRNLVTIAMLRRNLPDLKTDKGEHYAEILTSLYKQQMRVVWEEAKADKRRAGTLPNEGGEANTPRQKGQAKRHKSGPQGPQEAEHLPSAPETSPDRRTPEVKHAQADERQGPSESQLEQGGHRNGGAAGPSVAIATDVNAKERARTLAQGGDANGPSGHIDKTALPISTPRRIRDKEHLRYVASQPCIICGRAPGHAHHLRFAQPRALGRKVSDEWVVPLCATHHRALHGVGDEEQWWKERGIEPIGHARILWWTTRFGNVSDIDGAPSSLLKAQASNPSLVRK